MKKVIKFLSSPVVNMFFGLILYFILGYFINDYDSFDKLSALFGGFFVISIDIFMYGFNILVFYHKRSNDSKNFLDKENNS